jgi:CubicO group peptidase (beta-lactamase class C family)
MPGEADSRRRFAAVREILGGGIRQRAFPAATVEVGRRAGPVWRDAVGTLSYAVDAAPCTTDTIFDLASLTKVIATASIAMRHVTRGALALETPVADLSTAWSGDERRGVTIRQLLDHSSGLPAHARLFEFARGRDGFEREIGRTPLSQPPGEAAIYSDLGFILLGFILERVGSAPLDRQIADLAAALGEPLAFTPSPEWRPRIAPTEIDAWRGRLLVGDVHDENAAALGGVAGHAGLFGTAGAVGAFARLVLDTFAHDTRLGSPGLMRTFAARSRVPGSSRALAWDTMKPTSSCGPLMSPSAIGHTGFTGTSLWIDHEQDLYVVILTNRVHPSREPNLLAPMRRVLHTAILEGLRA